VSAVLQGLDLLAHVAFQTSALLRYGGLGLTMPVLASAGTRTSKQKKEASFPSAQKEVRVLRHTASAG
jgi:hypothetical protein